MRYKIDQSGKIEQTNKNTVLCLSNEYWDTVLIQAKTKRQIQEIFRRNGQIKNYVLFTFCAGISLLLKKNKWVKSVSIDREYHGKEPIIKKLIGEMLGTEAREINFVLIGRQSHAHLLAKEVFNKKKKPGKILGEIRLIEEIKMTEVGKRLKNA